MKRLNTLLATLACCIATASAQLATITNQWIQHNVTQNGANGMMVHLDFNIKGRRGTNNAILFSVDSPKGMAWMQMGPANRDMCGCVSFISYFTPGYDDTYYNDYQFFIPYGGLALTPENREYYLLATISDLTNGYISPTCYTYFGASGGMNSTPQAVSRSELGKYKNLYTVEFPSDPNTTSGAACRVCKQTGKCWNCGGHKFSPNHPRGVNVLCGACGGDGKCTACRGRGHH